jgi:hypothetical protein
MAKTNTINDAKEGPPGYTWSYLNFGGFTGPRGLTRQPTGRDSCRRT